MGKVRDVVAKGHSWREAGDPQAMTVVFLHGLGGSRLSWEPQLANLSQSYRCVAWDLPGYGHAAPLPCASVGFTDLAAAVVALLDELDVEQVHLVGISFGGMIAQYVAAWYPTRVRDSATKRVRFCEEAPAGSTSHRTAPLACCPERTRYVSRRFSSDR